MTYTYTDRELNYLNQGQAVYSVNSEYVQRNSNKTKRKQVLTPSPKNKHETNTLTTPDGQEFRVIATKSDIQTGFDGMAVAPIVNGRVDYHSVAVVAAGTDPDSKVNALGPLSRDVVSAIEARQTFLSPQYPVADQFVKKLLENPKYEISQLTAYSQSAYLLKVGAKYHIPTTTFNAWFKYGSLTPEEKSFMQKNPTMFVDYRKTEDSVTQWNDFNHPEWFNGQMDKKEPAFKTIHWVKGTSHQITAWYFDAKTGQVLDKKGGKALVSRLPSFSFQSQRAMA